MTPSPAVLIDAARSARTEQVLGRMRRAIPTQVLAPRLVTPPPTRPLGLFRGLGVDQAPDYGAKPPPHEEGAICAYGVCRRIDDVKLLSHTRDGLLFSFHVLGYSRLAEYAAGPRTRAGDETWNGLVGRWFDERDRPLGTVAWHPYPLSVRIVSWVASLEVLDRPLADRVLAELWREVRYLARALEWDVGGNHLIQNAVALCFGGALFPDTPLLDKGRRLLRRELDRQILGDGGHEERSPAYHRRIALQVDDVAELHARISHAAPGWLQDARDQMSSWMKVLQLPDGSLPLLNDAWDGPPLRGEASEGVTHLDRTGHLIVRSGDDVLIALVGELAPRHLPAHTHAHALSFVLWLDGQPVVSDPGVGVYTGSCREHFRGTAAHSTVAVDGVDQCEFWGDFRASLLPRPGPVALRRQDGILIASASHDGYGRLTDPVRHERTFVWWEGRGLVVVDRLACARSHATRSTVVLSSITPRVQCTALNGRARDERAPVARWIGEVERGARRVVEGPRSPGELWGWSILRDGASAELDRDRLRISAPGEKPRVLAI